jgi:hypothetical protein
MSLQQKLGLIAVLSLGVIIIVFSVIRIIVTNTVGAQPEISWLALWSAIESSIAVIVACLASFKVLLSSKRGTGGYDPSGEHYGGRYGNMSNGRKTTGNRKSMIGTNKSSGTKVAQRELTESYDDTEMNNLGGRYGGGTIVIGGKENRGRRFGEKEWDDDQDSQQQILHGDDIRVQTTWNVSRD